jgi:hypothetical protein
VFVFVHSHCMLCSCKLRPNGMVHSGQQVNACFPQVRATCTSTGGQYDGEPSCFSCVCESVCVPVCLCVCCLSARRCVCVVCLPRFVRFLFVCVSVVVVEVPSYRSCLGSNKIALTSDAVHDLRRGKQGGGKEGFPSGL